MISQEADPGLPFPYPCQKAAERGHGVGAGLGSGAALPPPSSTTLVKPLNLSRPRCPQLCKYRLC